MSDLLIWVVLLVVLFAVMGRRRRASQRDAKPMLSYRRVEGRELALGNAPGVPASAWKALALEDVPFAKRRRIIVSIACTAELSTEHVERLLWWLAGTLQTRAVAHAVVVESFATGDTAMLAGSGRLRLLFAADGRGWSGDERIIAVLDGAERQRKVFRLGDVHRRLQAAGGS